MGVEQYSLVANDWLNLESIINDLTQRVVGQELHPTSDPTFADLSLTGGLDITGDLDVGGDFTLSGMTQGSVLFAGASGLVSQDNSELFWDDTNKRLGIGTASPQRGFHLVDGAGSIPPHLSSKVQMVLQNNDSSGDDARIALLASVDGFSIIDFADSDDGDIGGIQYDHNSNSLGFVTNHAFRLYITGSGDVGIGTNVLTPDTKLQVVGDCKFGDDDTNYASFASDGELTLTGTARVIISQDLEPILATRPIANPPGEGTEDGFLTHDFNATTDESVYFHLELSHDYADAGTIHIHFDFFVDTAPASAESVVWGVEYKKQSIGDNFDFGTGTTTAYTQTPVTTGTPANDKKTHQSGEVSLVTTGFVAGDYILLRLFRDANGTGGTDDYSSDARVIDYHIEYLSDKLGEAT